MARDIMREISAHIDDYNDESYFHEKEKDANLAEFFSGKAGGTSEIYDALEEALQKDGKVTLSSSVIKEIEKHIDEYNDEVPENKPVQPAARTQNNTTSEKNRDKNRKAVLGQPVRRENPNKKTEAPEAKQLNTRDAEKPVKETSSHNSWAEALEKAMQAIDRDK